MNTDLDKTILVVVGSPTSEGQTAATLAITCRQDRAELGQGANSCNFESVKEKVM